MKKPKVTLVVGTYKNPSLLISTIEGFIHQSFKEFKVLVVDDNSPSDKEIIDKSISIVDSFNDARIKYIKNDVNIGVPHVYSKWINLVDTEYFYITGAGDKLFTDALSLMVNFLDENPNASLVHGLEKFVRSDNSEYEIKHPDKPKGIYPAFNYLQFHLIGGKNNLGWSQSSSVYRTELFKVKNIPVTNYHYWDHYFHCTYLIHSNQIGFLNEYLAIRHVDSSLVDWASTNVFVNRVERNVQTSRFLNEFETLLLQKAYPVNKYRVINAYKLIKGLFFGGKFNEFHLAFRLAITDLGSVLFSSIFYVLLFPFIQIVKNFKKN
jgi:glycosyltransferase involved in cell wall biosynthesis